jgi:hypothetical protein
VGGGSGARPDASSADRDRTTGGTGDVADRDLFGRTKRLSVPFKPADDSPEAPEPPLIKVARKALEKLRKKQQKDEEEREEFEELELELIVTPDGRAVMVEDQDPFEERDYEIAVDVNEAATELLHAMSTAPTTWQAATITITPDRVAATFTYPDLPTPPPPPVIDIELPAPTSADPSAPDQIDAPAIDVALDSPPDLDAAAERDTPE